MVGKHLEITKKPLVNDHSKSFGKGEDVSAESRDTVHTSLVLAMASHNGLDHALSILKRTRRQGLVRYVGIKYPLKIARRH